jgi:hypothetical protein
VGSVRFFNPSRFLSSVPVSFRFARFRSFRSFLAIVERNVTMYLANRQRPTFSFFFSFFPSPFSLRITHLDRDSAGLS